MEAARWGSVGISLYIDGHAYRVLGDRKVTVSNSVVYDQAVGGYLVPLSVQNYGGTTRPPIPADTYSVRWSFEVDPWMYRAGAGLRFSWLGN